ncbi:MAG: YbaK/EbsC family protein [Hyphomicrobium sp.]|uniref:aminoacyl-tRNA deacylase n=1 Tax=Hyphomicrobium sp. TaxID=82 RepID=UPI00132533E4|nr:YbaK/EbsC family protein [Hyphomicrobium sp.]KAB2941969.1 MAG: YbaK/EbsC family protein [Hyphomicrobium sp.]MBZ0211684.1 YbaK/EbsC family protein [Hyphomicrobium sp.]
MGIAISLQRYLDGRAVAYDVLTHDQTKSSLATAHASAVPEANLAKGVLIRRKDGYLLAIVPASCQVQLNAVGHWLKQPVGLATEEEVNAIFGDCEPGSVPPIAGAYGLPAVMDDRLEGFNDIYFEGGDHRTLVHVSGREFHRLMANVPHAPVADRSH